MDSKLATKFGLAVRTARIQMQLTQAELAEEVGISNEVCGRLERGLSLPRVRTLLRLCAALQVTSDVLLGFAKGPSGTAKGKRPGLLRLERPLSRLNDRSLDLLRLFLREAAKEQKKNATR